MKILTISFIILYSLTIIYYSDSIKIRMLPICAWQEFYVYYDNNSNKCECYKWYTRINWKFWCFKN